jgi:hypothetical protein
MKYLEQDAGDAGKELTPYEKHKLLGHKTTWYSPDSYQKIEECSECPMRFLHDPGIGYPTMLSPLKQTKGVYKTAKVKYEDGLYLKLMGTYGSEKLAKSHAKLQDKIEAAHDESGLPIWRLWYAPHDQEATKREYERYSKGE